MLLSEKHLQLASTLLAIAGILMLEVLATSSSAIEISDVSKLNASLIGKKIVLQGEIAWKKTASNHLQFGIRNQGEILAVKFNPSPWDNLIAVNDAVRVIGTFQNFQGKAELMIESIQTVNP